ncbi:MAG: hypothetical protein WCI74_03885 [Actinomycetes bacterium]
MRSVPKVAGVLACASLLALSGCSSGSSDGSTPTSPPTPTGSGSPFPKTSVKPGVPTTYQIVTGSTIDVTGQSQIVVTSGTMTITQSSKSGVLAASITIVGKSTSSGTKADVALVLSTDKNGVATGGTFDSNAGPTPMYWTVVPSGKINFLSSETATALVTVTPITLAQGGSTGNSKTPKNQLTLKVTGTRIAPPTTSTPSSTKGSSKSPSPTSTRY